MTPYARGLLGRIAEITAIGSLVFWRVLRLNVDYGPVWDWPLAVALLWLALVLTRRAHRRTEGILLVVCCLYLTIIYGYFQLNATVSFLWMCIDGLGDQSSFAHPTAMGATG